MTRAAGGVTTASAWTFALVDLAGFTALTETHGDDAAADLATEFADLARAQLGPDDKFVKAIGDAVLLASPDPGRGLQLLKRLLDACSAREQYPTTRSGVHHGPASARGDDFFGATVNLTARLAARASGGQVLGTGPVAAAARDLGLESQDLGDMVLKNVSESTRVHAIRLGTPLTMESIDPICRMRVRHHDAAGFLRHQGVEHWFCSAECAAIFAARVGSSE